MNFVTSIRYVTAEPNQRLLIRTSDKFLNKVWSNNSTAIKKFYQLADQLFEERANVRPLEKGLRAGDDPEKKRMTGKFGHFGPGGTFRSHLIVKPGQEYGVEFVDIPHADAVTHGIWRVLEFGLPSDKHRMPLADSRHPGIFMPASAEANRPGPGLPAKMFLTDAVDIVSLDLVEGWEKAADQVERDIAAGI